MLAMTTQDAGFRMTLTEGLSRSAAWRGEAVSLKGSLRFFSALLENGWRPSCLFSCKVSGKECQGGIRTRDASRVPESAC